MSRRTWVIVGATSIIAEEFARIAAHAGHTLLLIARDKQQLEIIAADIQLRFNVSCDVMVVDFAKDIQLFIQALHNQTIEMDLFIGHSFQLNNSQLTQQSLTELLTVNIISTNQLIHAYWNKKQAKHNVLFLSSVAAVRGRTKNSLYGASKAAIEVYLQGLQQGASKTQHITIARLGYIDTHATYGEPGIFYASQPKMCAQACWNALKSKKRCFYHPFFWHYIMTIMQRLPHSIYERLRGL